jgi:hypothetical protein
MAKKDKKDKKKVIKIVRRRRARRDTGLPKSVKALLGYLGKSDTALAGTPAPQRAQLAPQVLQQEAERMAGLAQRQAQQPSQPPPVFRTRQATGTFIAPSPVAVLRQQQPQLIAPPPTTKIVIKSEEPKNEKITELTRRVGLIESGGVKAVGALTYELEKMQKQITYHQGLDNDVFDNRTPARSAKPIIKESRFGSAVSLGDVKPLIVESPILQRKSLEQGYEPEAEEETSAQEYFAEQHIQKVTNPEIQPAVRLRGRKPGTKLSAEALESFREKRKLKKEEAKMQAGQALYQGASAKAAIEMIEELKPKKIMIKRQPRKKVELQEAQSMSSNIELMASGQTPIPPSAAAASGSAQKIASARLRLGESIKRL